MDLGIEGKTALVLGASGGLGGAIAEALAAEGVNVAIAGRNMEALQARAAAIGSRVKILPLAWDLGALDTIEQHFDTIERELGSVDILVNNTGGPPPSTASGVDAAAWSRAFETMVLPVIKITDRALPAMKEKSWGRIVTSTSSGILAPIPNLGVSNSLRSALLGWSKTLAREVAPFGITANIVLPGRVATPRIAQLDLARAKREGLEIDAVVADSLAQIPAGRYGDPKEYGDVVAFIASARASYVTGSVIRVDGGYISHV
ncbi:MAG: SDR family oxidoreductase [Beijerinckiaceae bacterium]|nr:SDR family oxidoreductase [Beijerinckiaceae bacterium]